MVRFNNAFRISMLILMVVAAVGGVLAYQGSVWGNIIWPGLVLTVSIGIVNVHAEGRDVTLSLVVWSAIFSFIIYSGLTYVVLGLFSRRNRTE